MSIYYTGQSSEQVSADDNVNLIKDLSKNNEKSKKYFVKPEDDTKDEKNVEEIIASSRAGRLKEMYFREYAQQSALRQKLFNSDNIGNFFRIYSIMMIPLASLVPSAVALYWATSGVTGIAINLLLLSPKLRNIVRIPQVEKEESKTPYIDLSNNIKARWAKILRYNK